MQINFCPVNFEQYLNGRNSQRLGREPWSSGYWEETHILKIVGLNSNIVLIIDQVSEDPKANNNNNNSSNYAN